MESGRSGTTDLLDDWYRGNEAALASLVERHLPTIRAMVRKRRSAYLQAREETSDFVQEAVVRFLRCGPHVRIESEKSFCAFLARVVQNMLHDRYDFYQAARRRGGSPVTLHTQDGEHSETPSRVLGESEARNLIRAGLEFLRTDDREIIFLHRWQNQSFDEIAVGLEIGKDAAAHRFYRAMGRLTGVVRRLENGQLDPLLADSDS